MRLSRTVVGILAENHDSHFIEGRRVERIKTELGGRKNHLSRLLFLSQEVSQRLHIGLLELRFQQLPPTATGLEMGQ